ncbi:MAG TPA: replicative DNA helicase [Phycisphaerales bacterium]|nr:replicative DNA helicase [Phycisphaerales bacterium]HMP35955.1 replicative DNA helicase [Phycisphaerales bacterium]
MAGSLHDRVDDGTEGANGSRHARGGRHGDGRSWRGPSPEQVRREASRLLETIPPHAIEAEMSVLGSMLLDDRVVGDIIAVLKGPDDFSRPAHGTIYRHMVELYDRENAVDIVKLHQRLLDRGVLESVGGLDYLVELGNSVPSSAFAVEHARMVRDKAILRSLIDAAGEILVDAHGAGLAARELLQSAEARIFAIAQDTEQASASSLAELIQDALQQIEANEGRHVTGIATGYYELDEMTSGFQPGELLVLAARPSMGKTALALNLAENIASGGAPVAIFSLEMSRQQLVQRLICARSGVDGHRLRRGMLSKDDYGRLLGACGELSSAPIFIDDTPGLTLLQLRSKARRLRERMNIEAVIIDYLQLMSVGGRVESRQIEVSEISRGVKAMARELRVPVVCLSQLNRAAEQREGHRPRMSDLRESGSIEQDADVVMMLHREDYYHQGDMAWLTANQAKIGVAELILAKQRNGPTGVVNLRWDSGTTRFLNLSWAGSPGGAQAAPRGGSAGAGSRGAPAEGGDRGGGSAHAPGGWTGRDGAAGSQFRGGPPTGPVDNFRDGGGPDLDEGIG